MRIIHNNRLRAIGVVACVVGVFQPDEGRAPLPLRQERGNGFIASVEYESASPAVRAVYNDIRATRNTDYVNNFWEMFANDQAALDRTWRP